MKSFAAAVALAAVQPAVVPDFGLPQGSGTPLGYGIEWQEELEAARAGDAEAVLELGHYEMERGRLGRALAWFEYGTQLGDVHAQDHVVWLHPFLDDAEKAQSEVFGAEIVLELWDVTERALGPTPLS